MKAKKVDGITDLQDYTDKHGMRVVVELRRDAHPQKILNYLLKHTALRSTFGVIMLALVNGAAEDPVLAAGDPALHPAPAGGDPPAHRVGAGPGAASAPTSSRA